MLKTTKLPKSTKWQRKLMSHFPKVGKISDSTYHAFALQKIQAKKMQAGKNT